MKKLAVDDFYTKSLLHFDGLEGGTTFTDESGKVWSPSGAAITSLLQSKFGGSSLYLSGAGPHIVTPDHADFDYAAGDFTIEFWMRPDSISSGQYIIYFHDASGYSPVLIYRDAANLLLCMSSGGAWNVANEVVIATVSAVTWTHIMLARSGSSFRFYQDGVYNGKVTSAATLVNAGNQLRIGSNGSGLYFDGYLDELRITKGYARQTTETSFTLPTAEYAPVYVTVPTTWNPSDKHPVIELSGGNLVATSTVSDGDYHALRSIFGASSGKYYWETIRTVNIQDTSTGILNAEGLLDRQPGVNSGGYDYTSVGKFRNNNIDVNTGNSYTIGINIGHALDLDAQKMWLSNEGVWEGNGDPGAGTNPQFTGISGTFYAAMSLSQNNMIGTAKFGATPMAYPAPMGFLHGLGAATSTYTITASAGANGSISPSGEVIVDSGDSQSFTITPTTYGNPGTPDYYISDVLVDGVSVGKTASYTFTNVVADHTIEAQFDNLEWPDLEVIRIAARDLLKEPIAAKYTDSIIKGWINEAVRDIAIKTSCYESIVSATTTADSRFVPFAGYKVRYVEYLPGSATRVGLLAITLKMLGRMSINGASPQYYFQWGSQVVIEPKPNAAFNLNLYIAQWPDYLQSDDDDEPLIPVEFHILILYYVLFKAYLRTWQFKTATQCYKLYVAGLNEAKHKHVIRIKDYRWNIQISDIITKVKNQIKGGSNYGLARLK